LHSVCPVAVHARAGVRSRPVKLLFVPAAAKRIANARKTKTANVNAIATKTAINANAATKMLPHARSATKMRINVNAAKMLPNNLS